MSELLDKLNEIVAILKASGSKHWYLSKTLWVNVVFIIAFVAQLKFGFVLSNEEQVAIITVANLLLRLISGKELTK